MYLIRGQEDEGEDGIKSVSYDTDDPLNSELQEKEPNSKRTITIIVPEAACTFGNSD